MAEVPDEGPSSGCIHRYVPSAQDPGAAGGPAALQGPPKGPHEQPQNSSHRLLSNPQLSHSRLGERRHTTGRLLSPDGAVEHLVLSILPILDGLFSRIQKQCGMFVQIWRDFYFPWRNEQR